MSVSATTSQVQSSSSSSSSSSTPAASPFNSVQILSTPVIVTDNRFPMYTPNQLENMQQPTFASSSFLSPADAAAASKAAAIFSASESSSNKEPQPTTPWLTYLKLNS